MSGKFSKQQLARLPLEMVAGGLITKDQLAVAQVTQQSLGGDLAEILVKKGFVEDVAVRDFVVDRLGLESVSLVDVDIDPSVIKAVPQSLAEAHKFIPIAKDGDVLIVAISDPLGLFALCASESLNVVIEPVVVDAAEIERAIQVHYREGGQSIDDTANISEVKVVQQAQEGTDSGGATEESAAREQVVRVVNSMISKAVAYEASDIHVEPQARDCRVRVRVDGMLKEIEILEKKVHSALVSRIKVMADMDIAERRIPQDGRIRLSVQGTIVDVRVSTLPTMYGEKVVMRLLVKSGTLTLEDLGLSSVDKGRFAELIERPYGIFLVTGPTGSGKTSTLYAALQRLNSQERNIVSVEDPVENEVAGINQSQVNVRAGMTFASALRSILRQDPDVIMIGEIRDGETADMAVRAALTGHLVFSTLHTNTALGAVERLADMEVERFLIGSALLGVMAQRLVRRICDECRREVEPKPEVITALGLDSWDHPVYLGKGCKACRMTGYRGRLGVFELVPTTQELRAGITRGDAEETLRELVRSQGVFDMRTDGLMKVKAGLTTLEEVLRVTQEG